MPMPTERVPFVGVGFDLLTMDEVLQHIEDVTVEEVRAVAAEVLTRPEVLAVVGPA